MTRSITIVVGFILGASLAACTEGPAGPKTSLEPTFHLSGRQIFMLDNCDPETFPGNCNPVNRSGGLSFSGFLDQLRRQGTVPAWRFSPDKIHVTETTTMDVENIGGLPHTFTEVAEFGGGFNATLNALSGNLTLAPECVDPANPTAPNSSVNIIAPGNHDHVTIQPVAGTKYMCCIHPWMRAVTH